MTTLPLRHYHVASLLVSALLLLEGVGCTGTPGDYLVFRLCVSEEEKAQHENTVAGTATFIDFHNGPDDSYLATGNSTTGADGISQEPAQGDADLACAESGLTTADDIDFEFVSSDEVTLRIDASSRWRGVETAQGEVAVVAMGLDADVATTPTHYYQYGFVFDTDGDPGNNYLASEAYPRDFFQGTDRWYQLTGAPATGWDFSVHGMVGGMPVHVASNATVLAFANGLVLLAPLDELGVADDIGFRITAFRHEGNWLADDWSGDCYPDVGAPLQALNP
jgi:hypothetical protein